MQGFDMKFTWYEITWTGKGMFKKLMQYVDKLFYGIPVFCIKSNVAMLVTETNNSNKN